MANQKPRVRWLTNVALNVKDSGGNVDEVVFKSGHYTHIEKILRATDGYGNIYLKGGDVIEGVKLDEAIEMHGDAVLEKVKELPKRKLEKIEEPVEDKTTKRKWPKAW